MLRGAHSKINFSLNLGRVDLKVVPVKEEIVAYHLQFFPNFFELPLFFNRFLNFAVAWCEAISVAGEGLVYWCKSVSVFFHEYMAIKWSRGQRSAVVRFESSSDN